MQSLPVMGLIFLLLLAQSRILPIFSFIHLPHHATQVSIPTPVRQRATNTAFLPLQKLPDSLDRESTTSDVLHNLYQTKQFAPYVGPHGTAVVTGGTGGIGLPTIEALAKTGMKIVLCTKDPVQAERAIRNISMRTYMDLNRIRIQYMDLSDLESVKRATEEIVRKEKRLDVILNCAAINSLPEKQLTAQNFEMQMGVNHISHFYLTRKLLPIMSHEGRVVTVSSMSHSKARTFEVEDLNSAQRRYSPFGNYCKSKLANILFASGLQDKLIESGSKVKSVSLHPGRVMTKRWSHTGEDVVSSVTDYILSRTPEQGAATVVYSCLVNSSQLDGGDYLMDCKSAIRSPLAQDEGGSLAFALWRNTEKLILNAGFEMPQDMVPRKVEAFSHAAIG